MYKDHWNGFMMLICFGIICLHVLLRYLFLPQKTDIRALSEITGREWGGSTGHKSPVNFPQEEQVI